MSVSPQELYRAGKLNEAIQALTAEVRQNPLDSKKRTFLFELLCFAGDWPRGEKQLDALSQGGQNAELGALLYRSALHAERERQQFFAEKAYIGQPPSPDQPLAGVCNGQAFTDIQDADPRIGPRLEVIVAGRYMWVAFAHIASIEIPAPKRLRDLLWTPALILNRSSFKGRDLGEVLLPVLSPATAQSADDAVRLGRSTVWEESEEGGIPFGQKMLTIDGEDIPLLEIRKIEFSYPAEASDEAAAGNGAE